MRIRKRRSLPRQIFGFLLALVMVAGMLQCFIPTANAAAVTNFTLYITDKAGGDRQVGTWSYDSENKTFRDADGIEAPFVKTFSGADTLYYSGKDNYIAPRMAVCTKGILISDLKTYVSNATGIALNDNATARWGMDNLSSSYPYSSLINRYYYPSYIIRDKTFDDNGKVEVPAVLAICSYNQRNLAGSANQGWGSANKLTELNGGVEVPVATDEASLAHAFNILTLGADDDRSLRVLLGQNAATPEDLNLGRMSLYNAACAGFTPEYLDIVTSVTNNDGSQATASVTMEDGYAKATAGELVSFTVSDVTPGYGVDAVSVSYGEAGTVDVSETSGVYTFTMPDAAVTINVSLKAIPSGATVWDGSVDVSWYNPTDTVFYLSTPAQLAGLAALVNGHLDVNHGPVTGEFTETDDYWTGIDDFKGKTIYLTADLNMGGVYDDSTDTWSGPNWTPVGGQYCTDVNDPDTLLSTTFNGTIDGQGHTLKNIYCNRYTPSSYEYSRTVGGVVGRLGCHDNDDPSLWADNPTVRNVAVTGYIYARRSTGGIVGKIGKTNKGGIIENCANFATVKNTDSKGCGGIVGAGWNGGHIKNCYNAGNVSSTYNCPTGGISGSNEIDIYNCYSVGNIAANADRFAMGIGTNNGGDQTVKNCYWLTGSAPGGGYYNGGSNVNVTEVTAEYMKSGEFLAALNGDGRAFVADTQNINKGYPILRVQTVDTTTLTSITKGSDPTKLSYVAGQTFDDTGLAIWANYSDGTKEKITNYTISKTDALETTDTTITVSGTYGGEAYSYDFPITVEANALASIAIKTPPASLLYAAGETFNPTGMVITATYTNGQTVTLTADEYTLSPNIETALTADDTRITVSYTYAGVTMTADQDITVLASAAPGKNDADVYELSTTDHMLWFANQVNTGLNNAISGKLLNNIDLSEVTWTPIGSSSTAKKYAGTFEGNGKTVTLALESSATAGLFGYLNDATVKNLTVAGSVTGGRYTAGIAGNATAATIENCINNATITSTSYEVGGIVGYTTGATTVTDCTNNGAVTATYNVGGIAGRVYGADTISKCANTGAVTATSTATSAAYSVGGIVGYTYAALTIDQCCNTGAVKGGVMNVGGVAGYLNNASAKLTDAYNTGGVTSESTSTNACVGGVLGRANNASCTVQNCYNAGAINVSNSGKYNAGVIGYAKGNTNVSNNYYLDTTASIGLGYTTDNAISKTSGEMKSAAFASLLGEGYIAQENGYPILAWQGPVAPAGYTVTFSVTGDNGTIAATVDGVAINTGAEVEAGKNVVFTATPVEGYQVKGWVLDGQTVADNTTNTLTVENLSADTTVTVEFEAEPVTPTKYTVTFTVTPEDANVTIKDSENAEVTAETDGTYKLEAGEYSYTVSAEGYVANTGTFTVSDKDETVIIILEAEVTTYTVTVDENITGGSVTVEPAEGVEDTTVTVTVTPDSGKQLVEGSLKYTMDGSSYTTITATEGVYSFTLPASGVTVTAEFENIAAPSTPPSLAATATTVGQDVVLSFTDDEVWRAVISGITVDGTALESDKYSLAPSAITIDKSVFPNAIDYDIAVIATGYSDATVTLTVQAAGNDKPVYTVTPAADAVYTIGATTDGIKTMTVNTGYSGLKYFAVGISPVISHSGDETAVFVHLRNGTQLELNASRADFDLVKAATAGFNVLPSDVVKAYLVDDLSNAVDFNPTILQ